MAYDAFWSFSLDDRATLLQVRALRSALHDRYEGERSQQKKSVGDFYVCDLQSYTDDWRANIRDALKAPAFIALVDEAYFAKPYCFFEWLAYDHLWDADCSLIGRTRQTLGVVATLDLTNRGAESLEIADATDLFKRTKQKFGAAKNQSTPDSELWRSVFQGRYDWSSEAGEQEIKAAICEWREALTRVQVTKVDPEDKEFADRRAALELLRSIGRAREAADQTAMELEKHVPSLRVPLQGAAQVALFCLAFDRFHDGGWGFSLEEDYLLDDDRQVLGAGAHEVNLLAIRSLRELLDPGTTYADELYRLVGRLEGESRANLDVTDRKHRLTSGLVHLVGKNEFMLGSKALSILQEATAEDKIRWIVQEPDDADDASVFLYSLCQKLGETTTKQAVARVLRYQRKEGAEELLEGLDARQVLRLQKLEAPYAERKSIEALFRSFVAAPESRVSREDLRRALQVSLLLSDREFAQRYCPAFAVVVRDQSKGEGAALSTSALALLCLMLSDMLFHASGAIAAGKITRGPRNDLINVRERFGLLWRELQDRVTGPDMLTILAGMNVVGWASLILLCEKQGVIEKNAAPQERDRRSSDWNDGLELRKTIGESVRQAKVAGALRGELLRKVVSSVRGVVEREGDKLGSIADEQLEEFAKRFLSRGILRDLPQDTVVELRPEGPGLLSHVGMLEVEKIHVKDPKPGEPDTELRVRSADDGYSKLFLAPFSERTSLRADNLNRMMRHFGGSDDELVKNISEVVVIECYEIVGAKLHQANFGERTRKITQSLTAGGGVAARDFLKLHGVRNGEVVYVRRNATLTEQQEPDGSVRTFYRWIFSDMTIEWELADYEKLVVRPSQDKSA